ncbi:MAG: RNA polymerase sigma factor [Fibrobacterota bacterium]
MKQTSIDEKTYVALWLDSGESSAFEYLYNAYKHKVYTLIIRMVRDQAVAEDILQETILSALKSIESFDRTRSFLSWLFGIAHKKTIDHIRHAKVVQKYQDEAADAMGSRIETPAGDTESGRIRTVLSAAVETLSPRQKEVFLMREMSGVPFKDIARITGCSLNNALGRMRLACEKIREEFRRRGYDGVQ